MVWWGTGALMKDREVRLMIRLVFLQPQRFSVASLGRKEWAVHTTPLLSLTEVLFPMLISEIFAWKEVSVFPPGSGRTTTRIFKEFLISVMEREVITYCYATVGIRTKPNGPFDERVLTAASLLRISGA